MKKLIVASNNAHKIEEIRAMLSKHSLEVVSLKDAGIDVEVEEDGNTFIENAFKKANEIHKLVPDCMVLADDSGLMVDALNGAPGIYSARFAGEHGNDKKNNEKLLEVMKDVKDEDRGAKFVSAIVLIVDDEKVIKVEGEVHGTILREERGTNGFGYDPLFYVSKHGKTFGEIDSEMKNSMSHRKRALEKVEAQLKKILQGE